MDFLTKIFPTATVEELETLFQTKSEWRNGLTWAAIYIKKNGYDKLSDTELLIEMSSAYEYSRYLQHCHIDFDWRGEAIPQELSDAMHKNANDIEALEFEIKRREMLKEADSS